MIIFHFRYFIKGIEMIMVARKEKELICSKEYSRLGYQYNSAVKIPA